MTTEDNILIDSLERNVEKLMTVVRDLQEENGRLLDTIAAKDSRIAELEEGIKSANDSYSNLKVSKVLSVSGYDLESTRQRVQGLVREIDKCIGLLKSSV